MCRVRGQRAIRRIAGSAEDCGGKASLAEIPKCTVGVKSLAGLISGVDFGDGGRQ